MPVVVVDGDAPPLADELEAALDAFEAREHRRSLVARDAGQLQRRQRRGGVLAVVGAGELELERDRLELPAAHHLWHVRRPGVEERSQLGLGPIASRDGRARCS